ncbi:hypothetical protein H920_19418 [Fukomys damarensis]|uniref:Uncharacterized protein n=1 Tax=Fukomys damarensis TaxID=885580 RepID=A0A091CKP6_FUKDA|nr:hypothetical protein H920_19418 [Fukomys damarensis]
MPGSTESLGKQVVVTEDGLPQPASISCNYASDFCSGQRGVIKACRYDQGPSSSDCDRSTIKMGHSWQQQKEYKA